MTRTLFAIALLFGGLAPFVGSGTALACTCAPTTVAAETNSADVIVTGNVVSSLDHGEAVFGVDQYLKGSGPEEILVVNPDKDREGFGDCDWLRMVDTDEELLLLRVEGKDLVKTGSWPCAGIDGIRGETELIQAIVEHTEGGAIPDDALNQAQEAEPEHKDVPWIPILALSIAIPVVFLAAWSFLGKRGGGGH